MELNDEFKDAIKKQFLELAIYNALGEELENELKAADCELILNDETFEFINCPQHLLDKVQEVIKSKAK